jgi:anti-sigma-K factor RskA
LYVGGFLCSLEIAMSNDRHVAEDLPAYALGILDGEEAVVVARHLAHCADCREELQSYQMVAEGLALAGPHRDPPARVKQRLMERVQPEYAAPRPESASILQQLASLFRRSAPAWGLAAVLLIVGLVTTNLWLWRQVDRSKQASLPERMQVVVLTGTEVAPSAAGALVLSDDGEYGTLVVDGLPPLDAEHEYQLWLIRDGVRTSGGVFAVNDEGYGALWVSAPGSLNSYPAFGITIEPLGGSAGPTGERVMGGSL